MGKSNDQSDFEKGQIHVPGKLKVLVFLKFEVVLEDIDLLYQIV